MELLYLWIEDDLLTIKNQGFIFSTKYHFNLTKENNHEWELEITKNEKYIPNFFNKIFDKKNILLSNIVNVTGIIGENGSGKTNLCNLLLTILSDRASDYRYILCLFDDISSSINVYNNTFKKLTINKEEEIIIINKRTRTSGGQFYTPLKNIDLANAFSIYYNPILDLRYKGYFSDEKIVDISSNALLIEANTESTEDQLLGKDLIGSFRYNDIKRQIDFLSSNTLADIVTISLPTHAEIILVNKRFDFNDKRMLKPKYLKLLENFQDKEKKEYQKLTNELDFLKNTKDQFISLDDLKNINNINREELEELNLKIQETLKERFLVLFYSSLVYNIFNTIHNSGDFEIEVGNIEFSADNSLEKTTYHIISQIDWKSKSNSSLALDARDIFKLISDIIKSKNNSSYSFLEDSNAFVVTLDESKRILNSLEKYNNSILSPNKYDFILFSWRSISSGEKALLDLYARLHYALKKIQTNNTTYFYIILDEGEMGFHPQWQKEYLYNTLKFIKYLFKSYKTQIILTSHSPFVVSDLPAEHLLFLKNINGLTLTFPLQEGSAFAANIHTLFTNSFFIKDGVRGKFAQKWIESEVSPYFKNENVNDIAYLQKIIDIIGEPTLKLLLEEKLISLKHRNV